MSLDLILQLYVLSVGLVVGSFLNVVIHRLPREESTVLPRSRCPHCNALIRAWHNIPVLSFLWLRGRCRSCAAPISWRYPAVELVTGLLFLTSYLRFGLTVDGVVAAAFCAAMVALATIDLEHFILPDAITLPGILLGLLVQHWLSWSTLPGAMIGVLLGAGLPLAIAGLWYWYRGVEGMGMGDVKMLAMVGAFLGWKGVLTTLFLGSLGGSLVGVALMLKRKLDMQSRLPFGFYLALGALLSLFWGEDLIRAYLGSLTWSGL